MNEQQIREAIAESGKMKVSDVVSYFNYRFAGQFDIKIVKSNAQEMITEAKLHYKK